jgi:hypothetical protein
MTITEQVEQALSDGVLNLREVKRILELMKEREEADAIMWNLREINPQDPCEGQVKRITWASDSIIRIIERSRMSVADRLKSAEQKIAKES